MINTQEQKHKVLYVRAVSKTRKGGRRRSMQSYFVQSKGLGEYKVSKYKSKSMLNIQNHIKKTTKLPKKAIIHRLEKDFKFKFKNMIVIAKRSFNTGISCNEIIKPIIEAAGFKDIVLKFLGAKNPINMIGAVEALLEKNKQYI